VASSVKVEPAKTVNEVAANQSNPPVSEPELHTADSPASTFVLSAGVQRSQSWLAANKYVLGALLVIAAAAVVGYFLR
jgi:hypothetical protein